MLDSVFVKNPDCFTRLLGWFRKHQDVKKASRWKLAFRPRLREFLQNLALSNAEVSPDRNDAYQVAFSELNKLAPLKVMDGLADSDLETPKENAPFWSPRKIEGYDLKAGLAGIETDAAALQKNDQLLMERYGRWTTGQFFRYRKFCVVYDGPREVADQWRGDWRHVSAPTSRNTGENRAELMQISVEAHEKLFKGLDDESSDASAAHRKKREEEKQIAAQANAIADAARKRTG